MLAGASIIIAEQTEDRGRANDRPSSRSWLA